ncbi:hypothetical protein K443DRAFT_617677 [Laccaria amethystina LaAM-08-1]|uniref:Uncharacterized protein n=1 Tax=Laccaria amethystina LaAM-08-1 TaxID=1095629 RepID=A0A0C9WPW9_9AGAR|nr:hypothetical protein K443DRAFT_617677 [Laccaria amethystina LaAM-08-1]
MHSLPTMSKLEYRTVTFRQFINNDSGSGAAKNLATWKSDLPNSWYYLGFAAMFPAPESSSGRSNPTCSSTSPTGLKYGTITVHTTRPTLRSGTVSVPLPITSSWVVSSAAATTNLPQRRRRTRLYIGRC